MNELLQGSNQLHSQIQNLPGVQQVRDSSNRDNIDVNTAIAGANPTAPNSGLAALNSDISNRQDLVHATNALYAQKPIFLSSLCMSNIEQEIQDWINLMSKMLMNPITYPNNNLPVILLSMRCLNIVAVIASGSEAKTTVQGKDKNECSTLWQKEIEGSQNSGELIEYLKNPHTGDILGSLIQNEICAQYDV